MSDLKGESVFFIDSDQFVQDLLDFILLRNFDEKGGGELTRPRNEIVVAVDLLLNFGPVVKVLGSDPLLNLKKNGLPIFEGQ